MLKSKPFILLALVILVASFQSVYCNDDEFAEFDDFASPDVELQSSKQVQQPTEANVLKESQPKTKSQDPIEQDSVKDSKSEDVRATNSQENESIKKKPDLKLVHVPTPIVYRWESYYVEIGFIFAFLLYFINFLVGGNKNSNIALQMYKSSGETLKHQFALVGGSPQVRDNQKRDDDGEATTSSPKKQKGIIKGNDSSYTVWCSGRLGMDGLLIELSLLRRQDLLTMAMNILKPSHDSIILRFVLNNEGYENFVFCIANKTQAPRLIRDMVDINTFCPKRKPISQYGVDSERLFIMSEIRDVTTFILDDSTISFLEENQKMIDFIHITDQYSTLRSEEMSAAQKLKNPKRMATFSFGLQPKLVNTSELINFSLSLLDRLRKFKLARDGKLKSEKNRQKINEILQKTALSQRQEAAQLKKDELRRLEKERMYNEDDPAKQRRWEKKEAKREQKKNKMRVKQLKVKSM